MEESVAIVLTKVDIDEAYFKQVCQVFPDLEKIRLQQEAAGDNLFNIFFNLFQKLREFRYEPTSEKRYECMFNIVELGNLINSMELGEEQPELFTIIKQYRNIVSDGFHAFSKEMGDLVIQEFSKLLNTFTEDGALQRFKDSFQRIASGSNTYMLISEGSREEQKNKIVKLLSQMKYFFEKTRSFVASGNIDGANLAYIVGANCARDFTRYFCEKEKRERRLKSLDLAECLGFFSEERDSHIRDVLLGAQDLCNKRAAFFAHQKSEAEKKKAVTFLTGKFLNTYEECFTNDLYIKINQYLHREFRAELLNLVDGSPRAYEPDAVKKRVAAVTPGASIERRRPREDVEEERGRERRDDSRDRSVRQRHDAEPEEIGMSEEMTMIAVHEVDLEDNVTIGQS